MKKLFLVATMLFLIGCVPAFADIFNPITPTNYKLSLTSVEPAAYLDNSTILTDAATIINYLGVKEGEAYNFHTGSFVTTTGATIITYTPWNLSVDATMLNADGVAAVLAWNVGAYLPVANVPVIKYFSYLYVDGGVGWEEDANKAFKPAPVLGAEFKFSF